jgi:flagellar hook-basal body complex protein FliE
MMPSGIESIAAVAATGTDIAATQLSRVQAAQSPTAPGAFAEILQRQLAELNASVGAAETAMRDLAAGKPVELHEVMIAMEHARVSVQTFVHIRNKVIESYQDLIRMQL